MYKNSARFHSRLYATGFIGSHRPSNGRHPKREKVGRSKSIRNRGTRFGVEEVINGQESRTCYSGVPRRVRRRSTTVPRQPKMLFPAQ